MMALAASHVLLLKVQQTAANSGLDIVLIDKKLHPLDYSTSIDTCSRGTSALYTSTDVLFDGQYQQVHFCTFGSPCLPIEPDIP